MTTTTHSNCDHPATKAARAACRKARAEVDTAALDLIAFFDSRWSSCDWVIKGAARFPKVNTDDRLIAARALIDWFADPNRYRGEVSPIITSPAEIRARILNAFS